MPEKSQREKLEAEFPQARLGTVSKGGTKLTYVPVGEVINRLNEVLGPSGWSWETTKVWRDEHDPDWVLALGKMTASVDGLETTKAGEGGVKIKYLKDGKTLVDLGDEFKGAASDALKKAAQKFGVALYLARTDQARKYEQPDDVFEPTNVGWRSNEEYKTLTDTLYAAVKACGSSVVEKMREHRERIGVAGPPTRDEYDLMLAEFKSLVSDWSDRLNPPGKASKASESNEKPTKTSAAPSSAAVPVSASQALTGWVTAEEATAAHNVLADKVEGLPEALLERVNTWRTEQGLTEVPLSKTNYERLNAFVDALMSSQATLT